MSTLATRSKVPPGDWKRTRPGVLVPTPAKIVSLPKPAPTGDSRFIAPLCQGGFAGYAQKKPHEYRVTAALPHINTLESLQVCVEVLRAQTERPFIMVVDTGSPPDVCAELIKMRAEDLEVHQIAGNGYRHSSEPVALALDFAQARCQTDLLLHTHTDCFLRRWDAVETLAALTNELSPAVGYRMSPRDWVTKDWGWMVGHTLLMLHMPTIHASGATWSFSRMRDQFGFDLQNMGGWPDTETGFNHALRAADIKPAFIGFDRNYERQVDDWIDHSRSYPGAKIGGHEEQLKKAAVWIEIGMKEARERLAQRKSTPPK